MFEGWGGALVIFFGYKGALVEPNQREPTANQFADEAHAGWKEGDASQHPTSKPETQLSPVHPSFEPQTHGDDF
jgi:hypothetical protein